MKVELDLKNLARHIDISLVRTDVTYDEIDTMVEACVKYGFINADVMPVFTPRLRNRLIMMGAVRTNLVGVAGFPSGANTTAIKVAETKEQLRMGCKEMDTVINVGALKSGLYDVVLEDLKAFVDACEGIPSKGILEICYLSDDEIKWGSELVVRSGCTFVKSGTGWGPKPTTVETIKVIKSAVGDDIYIKAAGGVRDLDTLLSMASEGCCRWGIGTKSAIRIMEEAAARLAGEEFELSLYEDGTASIAGE